ncbi:type II secretion system protein GspL [Marinimicrobium agarilyticum]|uniref:type II secretion system protein GspL n=1 Tax=Marinimicrobium agarilyticum TaxID=306546 RepID=UPI00042025AC|nr:type II secretion system protein GspL [Marinimicrobium agarilyticum]
MANQLVLYVNRAQDQFRWCWLDSESRPLLDSSASGDLETLVNTLGEGHHSAWLLVPGNQVVTRELEYAEAEKKHLRKLLPFQLEESVIGDIDQFHFALGQPKDGRVITAYMESAWLHELFGRLSEHHIEIQHAWPLPLALPLPKEPQPAESYPYWTLQLEGDVLMVRYAPNLGFSVEREQARMSLQMLLTAQNRVDNLPHLSLRAATDADLVALESLLPEELKDRVDEQAVVQLWQLDLHQTGLLDLCQGEFSQRLPVERWWRDWQGVVAAAAACLVLYIGATVYEVKTLEAENIELRRNIEQVYRGVAGQGNLVDAERQLKQRLSELQPTASGGRVTPFLGDVFPVLAGTDGVTVSAVSYSARSGELSLNIRAQTFNAIETLRSQMQEQGLEAQLLSSSSQGDAYNARLKVGGGRS